MNFADMTEGQLQAHVEAQGAVKELRSDLACLTKLVVVLAILLVLALAAVFAVLALVVG